MKKINNLFIRNDIDFIYKNIDKKYKELIFLELKQIFNKYYPLINIEYIDCLDQLNKSYNLLKDKNTISLDCWFKGKYNFRVSRVFKAFDIQTTPYNIIYENKPIIDDYEDLIIIDDDVCSGYTLNSVVKELNITNYKVYTLLDTQNINMYDVIDIRDFIVGAEYGGLMTEYGRLPYIYPFVNLETRATIKNQKDFSKEILNLNIEIFNQYEIKDNPLFNLENTKDLKQIYNKYFI